MWAHVVHGVLTMRTLVFLLAMIGCGGKQVPNDNFDDLAGVDLKSDVFSSRMKVVGSLRPGESSDSIRYSKSPRYRAVSLSGKGPATLSVVVRSTDDGDAVTWLLDSRFHILAKNDDADDTT